MYENHRKAIGAGMAILLVTACFIPAIAGAFPAGEEMRGKTDDRRGHHRSTLGIWRNPQLVQELGLADEQVKQMRDADFTFREKRLALKARLDGFRLQLDKAFSADSVDSAAVLQLAENMADIKGQMFVQEIESRVTLGRILTGDQIDKLKSYELDRRWNKRKQMGKRYSALTSDTPTIDIADHMRAASPFAVLDDTAKSLAPQMLARGGGGDGPGPDPGGPGMGDGEGPPPDNDFGDDTGTTG